MGTMTSFFLAPAAELSSHKLSEGVPATYPSLLCDYLDEVKVAILDHLLTGKEPAACLKDLTSEPVYTHAESGIEVYRLGDRLVRALAALTEGSPVAPAKKWLATGEWGRFGRRAGDLRDLVDMLASVATLASKSVETPALGMFVWVCP